MNPNNSTVSDEQHEDSRKKSLNYSKCNDIIDLTTDCHDENDILLINGNKHGTNNIHNIPLMTNIINNDNNTSKILIDKNGQSNNVDSFDVEIDNLPILKPVFETICLCDDDDDENDDNDILATRDNKDSDDLLSRHLLMISQQHQKEQHQQQQHRLQHDEQNASKDAFEKKRFSNIHQQQQEQQYQKQKHQYEVKEDNHTVSNFCSFQESTKRFKSYNVQNDVDSDNVIIIDDDEMITNDRSIIGAETSIYDYRNNCNNTNTNTNSSSSKYRVEQNLFEFQNEESISINPNDLAISNDGNVLVFIGDTASNDDCILTAGIMDLINKKNYSNDNSISSKDQQEQQLKAGKRKHQPQQLKRTVYTCYNHTIQHIEQQESWSCGYRNTQMMLSSLIPLLSHDHTYYHNNTNSNYIAGICTIPSKYQIQQTIEEYWTKGYDNTGAKHYNNRIINTTSKIGAVEVATYLQYISIDCTIVQFMKCIQSRQLIGPFCYNYFYYTTTSGVLDSANGTSNSVSYHPNSRTIATTALNSCTNVNATCTSAGIYTQQQQPRHQKQIPLYLQWEGHSVTIIGIELRTDNTVKYLLVLDPAKNGSKIFNNLSIKRDTNDVSILRLPCNIVEKKDCQLIVCSTQSVSTAVMSNVKKTVTVITAAENDVKQSIASTTTSQIFPNKRGYY